MEYAARELFARAGIPAPRGLVIEDAARAAEDLQKAALRYPVVVKAQVPIGGRGKAGGIRFADDEAQVLCHARDMLGSSLRGYPVRRVLVAEKAEVEAEWYLSILLDRAAKLPVLLFSPLGGMEIEQAAREHPEQVVRAVIDPQIGVKDYLARYLLSKCGLPQAYAGPLHALIQSLYRCFCHSDALLCEINPLAAARGELIALDGKVEVDDSALYRQDELRALRDAEPEEEFVKEARAYNFLYIPVTAGGEVAVCSNGSGMLMSCIDLIAQEDMRVAAALDLGGGATKERIAEALRILFATPGVEMVLINIFGGITRCDEVAGGVALALARHALDGKFIVLRMEGTNKEAGLQIIRGLEGGKVCLADGLRACIRALAERRGRM